MTDFTDPAKFHQVHPHLRVTTTGSGEILHRAMPVTAGLGPTVAKCGTETPIYVARWGNIVPVERACTGCFANTTA